MNFQISKASNGWVLTHYRAEDGRASNPTAYLAPETAVFNTVDAMLAHLEDKLCPPVASVAAEQEPPFVAPSQKSTETMLDLPEEVVEADIRKLDDALQRAPEGEAHRVLFTDASAPDPDYGTGL